MRDFWGGLPIAHRGRAILLLSCVALCCALLNPVLNMADWVGWLPSTVSASESGAVWLPSIACGSAAWLAGQPRAHGMNEWVITSPRSTAGRLVPSLAGGAFIGLTGQCLAIAFLGLVSWHYGADSAPASIDLLLSVPTFSAYIFFWVGIGGFLGRAARRQFALPTAVLLPYCFYAVLSLYFMDSALDVLSIGDGRVYDYVRPSHGMVIVRFLFWVLLASCLFAWLLERRRFAAVCRWLTSIVAALAIFQGISFVPLKGATDADCVGTSPMTCLDGSHASTQARYRSALRVLWPTVPPSLRPPVVTADERLNTSARAALVVPPVNGTVEPARLIAQEVFAARFGNALFVHSCTDQSSGYATAVSLNIWWRQTHGLPIDKEAFIGDVIYSQMDSQFEKHLHAARVIADWSAEFRDRWFDNHRAQIASCSTPASDVE